MGAILVSEQIANRYAKRLASIAPDRDLVVLGPDGLRSPLEDQREHRWGRQISHDLEGTTLPVLGLGPIGLEVGRAGAGRLCVAVPLTPETRHLIDKACLTQMKSDWANCSTSPRSSKLSRTERLRVPYSMFSKQNLCRNQIRFGIYPMSSSRHTATDVTRSIY